MKNNKIVGQYLFTNYANQTTYLYSFSFCIGPEIFSNVKWFERQFLISIHEQNNETKHSISIATWNMETNFHLDLKSGLEISGH